MEELLTTIASEAKHDKDETVCRTCYAVKEILADRTSLLKSPVYEIREKCLSIVISCLEHKSSKVKSLGVSACQKLLRDDRFWVCDIDNEDLLLPFQLTKVIETHIKSQPENIQIDLLKVLLEMIFFGYTTVNSKIVISVVSICLKVSAGSKSSSLTEAAETTSSQSVQCFAKHLMTDEENHVEDIEKLSSEMVALLSFFCQTMSDVNTKSGENDGKNSMTLLLRCCHSVLSVLQPRSKIIDDAFEKLLWKTFCPLLIEHLTPGKLKHVGCNEPFKESPDNHDFGRGSQNLPGTKERKLHSQKDIFSISNELLRLFGDEQSMRSVLEALLHRLLLYPSVSSRLETLKYVREILNQPGLIVKMSATSTPVDVSKELSLLKLFTDCVKECSYSDDSRLINQSVLCVADFLTSLEKIASGVGLENQEVIKLLIEEEDTLSQCAESFDNFSKNDGVTRKPQESFMSRDFSDFKISSYKDKLGEILPSTSGSSTPSSLSSLSKSVSNNLSEEDTTSKDSETEGDDQHTTVLKEPSIDSNTKTVEERENARQFFCSLKSQVDHLLSLRTEVEVDNHLLQFVSNFCSKVWENRGEQPSGFCTKTNVIINSDGLYFSAFAGFVLNLKLILLKYYENEEHVELPTTEQKFIDDILKNEVLIYLSPTWLREFYQQILANSILPESLLLTDTNRKQSALVRLIIDCEKFDGFSCIPQSHQLSYFLKFESAISQQAPNDERMIAGKKLTKRIIGNLWHSITTTMSSLFRNESTNVSLVTLLVSDNSKENFEKRETLISCLTALQITVKLCINLNMQSKCNSIYDMLTKSVVNPTNENLYRKLSNNEPCLHSAQVLSLHSIFTGALEVASYCKPCWDFVFTCCSYVINLEYHHYSKRTFSKETKNRFTNFFKFKKENKDELILNFGEVENVTSIMRVKNQADVSHCLQNCLGERSAEVLRGKEFETAITCLTYLAENVFHDAASRLNLESLVVFLESLICSSGRELAAKRNISSLDRVPLLFNRFCDVVLRIAKSGRPLLHVMKCWSIAAPHLIDAASRKEDMSVCKVAVFTINDFIGIVLSTYAELPYFHFNEALFKPYENLLLLELCECDVQEMIVSSICGFVEGFKEELRSGWRSLFCALRGIRLPSIPFSNHAADAYELEMERVRQLRVVLDIFEAFLSTNNLDIFANAAVDCLLCLLGLLKDSADEVLVEGVDGDENHYAVDLCVLSLKYIHQFESLLRLMYTMPACPVFTCTRTIVSCSESKTIDVPRVCQDEFKLSVSRLLSDFDRPVKILHVWFLLLDGLTNAVTFCPSQHQGQLIEMSLSLMGTLRQNPGKEFAIYCINHIALPVMQRWSNSLLSDRIPKYDLHLRSFKQYSGLVSHLVVEHLKIATTDDIDSDVVLMFTQTVCLFIELSATSQWPLKGLSSACLTHIIVESHRHWNQELWKVMCKALNILTTMHTEKLQEVIDAFPNKTINFYKDLAKVKVIKNRSSEVHKEKRSFSEKVNVVGFAQEIFSLESQRGPATSSELSDCTFMLQITKDENGDEINQEIMFADIVRDLLSQKAILMTLCEILLYNLPYTLPNVSSMQRKGPNSPLIDEIDINIINEVLDIFSKSSSMAYEFDARPGLKFLFQKLCSLNVPANLYCFSAISFSVSFLTRYYFAVQTGKCEEQIFENLKRLIEGACEHYTDFILQNESSNTRLDELCQRPILLLPYKINFEEYIKPGDEVETESGETSLKLVDDQAYRIIDPKQIEEFTADYKKWKQQYSPIPPSFSQRVAHKSQLPKRRHFTNVSSLSDVEKENDVSFMKDTEAYVCLWTQILQSMFELHLACSPSLFQKLLPVFEPGVELILLYASSKELRSVLVLWLRQVSQILHGAVGL